jgi:hypothetical protein
MAKSKDTFSRYTKATTDITPRIIGASVGEIGAGKTHFWLGAPQPIVVQTMDLGLEGVVQKFAADKDIYVASYDIGATIGESFTVEKAKDAWAKFLEDFEDASQKARTIIWDRETDLWKLLCKAMWGTDDAYGAAGAKDWDSAKDYIRRMIALAKGVEGLNFGILQGMKNEWIPGKLNPATGKRPGVQSGNRIPDGMDDIGALANMVFHHENVGKDFRINVTKARGPAGMDVQGETFENIDFVTLATAIFPDTTEEDWA